MNESSKIDSANLTSTPTASQLTAEQRDALARVYRFLLSLRAEKTKVEEGAGRPAPEDASREEKSGKRVADVSKS